MLGGRNQHAFLHQTGGVADLGDVLADGFHDETIQIDTPENHSGAHRGRQNSHVHRHTAVQTDAPELNRRTNCMFEAHFAL